LELDRFPPYQGLAWDERICNPDHPNFWKYGVANLLFLDHVRERKIILDVGCGTGGSTLFLAQHVKADLIIGVDAVKSMMRVAKINAIRKGFSAKASFMICDGRYLPFKSSCFDAIVSRGDAFCFLIPLKDAAREFRRVMSHLAVAVLEMDNRRDWKLGSIISTNLQKMAEGRIACIVEVFDSERNHVATYHFLDMSGRIAKEVSSDAEFAVKGHKKCEYSPAEIAKETVETTRGVPTHWPTVKELRRIFTENGYKDIEMTGDGMLMKLLLDGEKTIIDAMKKQPQLFFKIEHELVHLLDPEKSPTIILKAVKG
jgi:ubiquinone/menaquinone biosynthesis C-methylase UbiE